MSIFQQKRGDSCETSFLKLTVDYTRQCIRHSQQHLIDCQKQLLRASADGDLIVLTRFLNQGWSTEIATKNRYTLLLIASAHGQAEAVELLLSRRANIHARQKNHLSSLEIARARGFEKVENILQEYLKKEQLWLEKQRVQDLEPVKRCDSV